MDILEVKYILNTFSLLFFAALVMWMSAGFCMLESGMVKSKSVAVICLKNIVIYSLACLCYYIIGYNLMFVDVGQWIGSFQFFVFPSANELSYLQGGVSSDLLPSLLKTGHFSLAAVFFQMVFVATAASVISGSLAERVKLFPFFIFIVVLASFIYPVVGAWTWGNGWLAQIGFKDFAGSTIVHSVGGWAALFGVMFLGPRIGKYKKDGSVVLTPPSNIPLVSLGVFILWFGWLGFNGGSVLSLSSVLDVATMSLVFFNTNLAAVGGLLAAMVLSFFVYKRVQILLIFNGALSGLVSITAGPDIVNPLLAFFIGIVGGVLASFASHLLDKWKIDDVVGAIPVHLVAGIWGTLAVGLFSDKISFLTQLIGVLSIGAFVSVCSIITWFILKTFTKIRVSEMSETIGQDITELGIESYPEFLNIENLQE